MKKSIALAIIGCMLLVIAGCVSSKSSTPVSVSASASISAATPASGGKSYKLVFATSVSEKSPETQGLIHLGKILEERSNGRITGEAFYGGSLGSEAEIVEQTRTGAIHAAVAAWDTWDLLASEYTPWVVPYLYKNSDQVLRSWEGKTGDAMREEFAKNNLLCYGLIFRGNRQLTSNKLIEKPADLVGLKLRLPQTAAWVKVWTQLGAMPTTIATAEVFSALQTGVVDAQENPIISNNQKGLQEVQKYTVMTNHIVDFIGYLVCKPFIDELNAEDRALVETAIKDATAYAQELYKEQEAEARAAMEKAGMKFVDIDVAPFKEKALANIDSLKGNWADWVYDEALNDTAN